MKYLTLVLLTIVVLAEPVCAQDTPATLESGRLDDALALNAVLSDIDRDIGRLQGRLDTVLMSIGVVFASIVGFGVFLFTRIEALGRRIEKLEDIRRDLEQIILLLKQDIFRHRG